ncbi:hypothetical protein BDV98DRAFT_573325 [Pterulicium gracile]|uniref:Uncharacterized protein n=1 Tax=Pterulicium gracile TaxID=1884261 RepID=A0A5C3QAN2_9AGAR|nr:hypothetical protein BDV98DRAFT_573325 [Pterula gracilis]
MRIIWKIESEYIHWQCPRRSKKRWKVLVLFLLTFSLPEGLGLHGGTNQEMEDESPMVVFEKNERMCGL